MVRIDDPGKGRFVGLGTDVGVGGPDQLVAGHAMAGRRHPTEAEIGGIRQDRGEQCVLLVTAFAGAQIGESGREARRPVHLVQQLGDAHARHHRLDYVCKGARLRRDGRLDRRHLQAPVAKFDTLQLVPLQPSREALQPAIEFGGLRRQPLICRCRQAKLCRGGRDGGGRQEVAVEPAIAGRALDPDVTRAQLVAQGCEHCHLVETSVRCTAFRDEAAPLLAERHRRVRRHLALGRIG